MNVQMKEFLEDFIPDLVLLDLQQKLIGLEQAHDCTAAYNTKLRKALTKVIKAYENGDIDV